jgi:hypothetical protein
MRVICGDRLKRFVYLVVASVCVVVAGFQQTLGPLVCLALAPRPQLNLALDQIGPQCAALTLFLLLLAQPFAFYTRGFAQFGSFFAGVQQSAPDPAILSALITQNGAIRKQSVPRAGILQGEFSICSLRRPTTYGNRRPACPGALSLRVQGYLQDAVVAQW